MADLEISREGRVVRLTLRREGANNALNLDLCRVLVDALETAAQDHEVAAVLLEARGRFFCAGFDPGEAQDIYPIHSALFGLGARLSKPLIAAIQGPALSAGMGLVAVAHIAVAAHGVQFGLTDIRDGHWPYAVFPSVAKAVGERRALEMALTGRVFGVNEALQYGLIHEVAPAIELDDRASAIARWVASADPEIVSRGMRFSRGKHSPKEEKP
jgi:enoyl-CoA hydratase/carnithine racemase